MNAPRALDDLVPEVYDDLRRLAARHLHRERQDHVLQVTALVHEAYLRLAGTPELEVRCRGELLALATGAMRHILVDHARARRSAKRGGDRLHVTLTDGLDAAAPATVDLAALDAALDRLAALDQRQAAIVELRFLAGLSVEDTAEAVGISPATVKRETAFARAWLFRELSEGASAGAH
jgi:RNA polymerase sigma factor (TIGR02999 family)